MTEYTVMQGDACASLQRVPAGTVRCCVTSPPYYGLRNYDVDGQIGLEESLGQYIAALVGVFREVRRVLTGDGTLWLNIGDSFSSGNRGTYDPAIVSRTSGLKNHAGAVGARRPPMPPGVKPKDLLGVPWQLAFALREDGWYLRSDIIWAKPNPMPESVRDRPTRSHEYLFLLSKSERYFYDADAIAEPAAASTTARLAQPTFTGQQGGPKDYRDGTNRNRSARKMVENLWDKAKAGGTLLRNRRDVWHIPTSPHPFAHFAVFPEALVEPCILAGSVPGDTVLDPFAGSGTTLRVAVRHGRKGLGIELNPEYVDIIHERVGVQQTLPLERAA